MERDGWLMVLVGLMALAPSFLLAIMIFATGLGLEFGAGLPRSRPAVDVAIDPLRATVGVGTGFLLIGAAAWIIKRTDWSDED